MGCLRGLRTRQVLRRIVTYIGLYILPSSFFRQVLRQIVGERIATGRMGGSTVGSARRVGRGGGGGGGVGGIAGMHVIDIM